MLLRFKGAEGLLLKKILKKILFKKVKKKIIIKIVIIIKGGKLMIKKKGILFVVVFCLLCCITVFAEENTKTIENDMTMEKFINIPIAIGRSKNDPSFLVSAGARFTTIFLL